MTIAGALVRLHPSSSLTPKSNPSFPNDVFASRFKFSACCPPPSRRSPDACRIYAPLSLNRLVDEFDPKIPIEEAFTPPSSWYTDPSFLALELDRVFSHGWLAAEFHHEVFNLVAGVDSFTSLIKLDVHGNRSSKLCFTEQIENPHDFFTGRFGTVEFVICRDANGELHAFHNVCRHHASLLATGSGHKPCFVCPYHGWTYGLDGALLKATRIGGIRNFDKDEFGLIPLSVATWGPFVLISLDNDFLHKQNVADEVVENEWLGNASQILIAGGINSSLKHVCRREYTINCNWKVFCDNYLDGGYHVPFAHGGLASGLNLNSYSTHIFEKASVQRCDSASVDASDFDRLGSKACYAFIYPNFMINRYGPWMDTNLVLPLDSTKCQVIFDYFLDASLVNDKVFIEESLKESERVQIEDIALCEGVQKGLESPAYCSGRYAPSVEMAMHHFHVLLHQNLNNL